MSDPCISIIEPYSNQTVGNSFKIKIKVDNCFLSSTSYYYKVYYDNDDNNTDMKSIDKDKKRYSSSFTANLPDGDYFLIVILYMKVPKSKEDNEI